MTMMMPSRPGKTLEAVREQVEADDAGKWDAVARASEITLRHGRLHFPHAASDGFDMGLTPTPWATAQACAKLGIPSGYFRKCPAELRDANFNHWVQQEETLRTLTQGDKEAAEGSSQWLLRAKGSTLRGVLSPKYAKLDNRQFLDALMPLVTDAKRYQVNFASLTEESFHLRLIDPTIARDVLPGDRLLVGIHLANSEVGLRAVTVDAAVFRVVCLNGLIRRVNRRSLLRQRHIHVDEPRFAEMLAEALREAVAVAAGFMEQMTFATRTPVPDPDAAIDFLGQAWNLPKATTDMIRFTLMGESGQQETLYGLVNAITQSAQRIGSVDDRFELETLAGLLVNTTTTRIADTTLRRRILAPK